MADLLPTERLQPSLLDRLTDDAPQDKVEAREKRVLSLKQLRESVLRDLAWLFNTISLESTDDFSQDTFAASSVINYGIPALSGANISNKDLYKLEKKFKKAILDFEPRIIASSLKVNIITDIAQMNQRAISFTISGLLWAQPLPMEIYMRSDIDLLTNQVSVQQIG